MQKTATIGPNRGVLWTIGMTLALLSGLTGAATANQASSTPTGTQTQPGPDATPDTAEAGPYEVLQRQIELSEYAPAINQLEQEVQAIERAKHRYHEDLVEPLMLLGEAKHGAGDFPGALDAYGRAVHLTRVSSGLHSAEQVDAVYREASVFKSAGDLKQANDREEYAWQILQKAHGRYSPKLLPGIKHLADWYGETYNVLAARGLYMRAVRIVEANYDEQHPEMVASLRGLANTYRLERFPPNYLNSASTDVGAVTPRNALTENNSAILLNRFPQGEKALKRIVRIQQANLAKLEPPIVSAIAVEPDSEPPSNDGQTPTVDDAAEPRPVTPPQDAPLADPAEVAKARQQLVVALVELGDWFLLFEKSRIALQYYAQAEAVNARLGTEYSALDFSRPQLLHFPAPGDPRPPKPRYRGERKEGYVELNYSINVRGSVANLKTIDSSPKGLMDYRVRKSLLSSRYRPSIVNGTPIATQGYSYRHKFSYYPSQSDPADQTSKEPAPQGQTSEPGPVEVEPNADAAAAAASE